MDTNNSTASIVTKKKIVKKNKDIQQSIVSNEIINNNNTLENITNNTLENITNNSNTTIVTKKKIVKNNKGIQPSIVSNEIINNNTLENITQITHIAQDIQNINIIDYSDTIIYCKNINKNIIELQNKIKAMHQILWENEHMDGEEALDEIMKLIFLKYLGKFISDKETPNKVDLLNPIYVNSLIQYADKDELEIFNKAVEYLKDFKNITIDIEKGVKDGLIFKTKDKNAYLESPFINQIFNKTTNQDIFKMITTILSKHDTTKLLYTGKNTLLSITNINTLIELIKHINSDCFDNANEIEDLIGEIYEYFLNKYNKKKSALGQYFTPRMLMTITIKYKFNSILNIVNTTETPIIADKCMGTGGWLVKLYNTMHEHNNNILLHGREYKSNTFQYGIINLISTTGNYPYKTASGCSLSNIENFKVHIVISNPPFKGKYEYNKLKEDYKINKRDEYNQTPFEEIYFLKDEDNTPLQFLQLYIHSLAEGGLCIIVLPYGELFFKDGKMINIRKQLLNKINITDIILCPTGIFTHTDVKVCMFIFEKNITGTKAIKFSKFQFDKTNQILQSIKHITTVTKNDILKERICSFYHTDYLQDELINTMQLSMPSFEWLEFGDVFDLIKGELQSSKLLQIEDDELFDGINYIKLITGAKDENLKIINKQHISYCEGENVFISENGNGNCRPVKFYNGNCNYSNLLSLLKTKPAYETKIHKKYIYYYLKSIQLHIEANYQKGACNQTLDVKNFNRMKIPIPHMKSQLHIITQMDAANGKCDGLQKIVDIMKFTDVPLRFQIGLDLSPSSIEFVKFGDVFDLIKGELQSSKVEEDLNGDILFISKCDINELTPKINHNTFYNDGLFIANAFNGNGKCPIRYTDKKCIHSNLLSLLKTKPEYENRINKKYIYHYLKSIQSHIEENYSKGACQQTLDVKNFNRTHIPLLPIELQNYIVNTINNLEKVIVRWEQDIENLKKEDCLTFSVYLKNEYNKLFNSAVQVIPV